MYQPENLKLRSNVPSDVERQTRIDLAGYYAHCSALDDCMGELLRTLRETGLERNTILIFTADHGDMLGSQGMRAKQKPFDESVRIPLLIHWPASLGTRARTLDAPINSEDLMPTLLGLCHLPIPKTVEGLSYSRYLSGGKNPSDGAVLIACIGPFGEWPRSRGGREYRGVRTTRYTYVRDLNGPWLLFDNKKDPFELENLVDSARHARLQHNLERLLQRKLRAASDQFLSADEYIRQWNYQVDATGTVPYTP